MITTEERLEQRVKIIKQLRDFLQRQREKFRSYLEVLDSQQTAILADDAESLRIHVEIEQAVVGEIITLQRVINPLEDLYHQTIPEQESDVDQLTASLDRLKDQVLQRNRINQDLLLERMTELRQRISSIDRPQNRRSPFAKIGEPTLVDISS